MNLKTYIVVFLLNFCLFRKSEFIGGLSHALSDNLDALTFNPAGMGVDRSKQIGFGIDIKQNNDLNAGIALRSGGFGILVHRFANGRSMREIFSTQIRNS